MGEWWSLFYESPREGGDVVDLEDREHDWIVARDSNQRTIGTLPSISLSTLYTSTRVARACDGGMLGGVPMECCGRLVTRFLVNWTELFDLNARPNTSVPSRYRTLPGTTSLVLLSILGRVYSAKSVLVPKVPDFENIKFSASYVQSRFGGTCRLVYGQVVLSIQIFWYSSPGQPVLILHDLYLESFIKRYRTYSEIRLIPA